jgi:hypothetical protein
MLCYAVLCYAVLCYAMLCCAMLSCTVLCYHLPRAVLCLQDMIDPKTLLCNTAKGGQGQGQGRVSPHCCVCCACSMRYMHCTR